MIEDYNSENSVASLVKSDMLDNNIKKIKARGLISTDEPCHNTTCTYKQKLKIFEEKYKIQSAESKRLLNQVRSLTDKFEAEMTPEEKEQAFKSLAESSKINALNKVNAELELKIGALQSELEEQLKLNAKVDSEHRRIMEAFNADKTIQEKLARIATYDHEIEILKNKKDELDSSILKATNQKFLIERQHDEALDQFNRDMKKLRETKKTIKSSSKSIRISHKEQDSNLFKRIIRWLT